MTINLGDQVRDTISGWQGTAVARYSFLYGCERISIEGTDKDGEPKELVFDEQRVERVAAPAVAPVRSAVGGPRDLASVRHAEPS